MRTRLCLHWLPALLLAACSGQDTAGPSLPPLGSLGISVMGLPDSVAAVVVTGPMGFTRAVTATTTLTGLAEGAYTVTASTVMVLTVTYVPNATSTSVTVTADSQAAAVVTYRLAGGSATGTWHFAMTASGSTGNCSMSGTFAIVQVEPDSAFTAIGQEAGACARHGIAWGGLPVVGTALDGVIRFQLAPCSYSGAILPAQSDSMSGRVTCMMQTHIGTRPGCVGNRCALYRTDYFVGNWTATRDPPAGAPRWEWPASPGSQAWVGDGRSISEGGSLDTSTRLRDSHGS